MHSVEGGGRDRAAGKHRTGMFVNIILTTNVNQLKTSNDDE